MKYTKMNISAFLCSHFRLPSWLSGWKLWLFNKILSCADMLLRLASVAVQLIGLVIVIAILPFFLLGGSALHVLAICVGVGRLLCSKIYNYFKGEGEKPLVQSENKVGTEEKEYSEIQNICYQDSYLKICVDTKNSDGYYIDDSDIDDSDIGESIKMLFEREDNCSQDLYIPL